MIEEKCLSLPRFMENVFGEIKDISVFVLEKPFEELLILTFSSPIEGVRTYATLGLSKIDLFYVKNNENFPLKEELIFGIRLKNTEEEGKYRRMLIAFTETVFKSNRKILQRGNVVNIGERIIEKTHMSVFYICNPVAYTDDPAIVYSCTSLITVFLWLIPIYDSERIFIEQNSWRYFETLLENNDCDIFDLQRGSVV